MMPRTRLLKCSVFNTLFCKTQHLRSLIRAIIRGFEWLEIVGLSSGFLRRPQNCINVKTKRKIVPNCCGLLRTIENIWTSLTRIFDKKLCTALCTKEVPLQNDASRQGFFANHQPRVFKLLHKTSKKEKRGYVAQWPFLYDIVQLIWGPFVH